MMVSETVIVITHDTFLRLSISVLMKQICCDKKILLLDVDSFNSLDELYGVLSQMSKDEAIRIILISRGLWLSQVISSVINISVFDSLNKWRYLLTTAKLNSIDNIMDNIDCIKNLRGMSACEVETIQSLKSSSSITLAAKKSGSSYKNFVKNTITIARRYNLKNTTHLHFFVYRYSQ